MREKIMEYIDELDFEIDRCMAQIQEFIDNDPYQMNAMRIRMNTLVEVKNDLKSRLEELI